MRVAIVCTFPAGTKKYDDITGALKKGADMNGNQTDVLYAGRDTMHLMIYDYIAVVAVPSGFWGSTVSSKIQTYLTDGSISSGRKGCSVIIKKGLGAAKASRRLMAVLEKCGIMLDNFEILRSPEDALVAGKKI